jgi:hypothetical protein
MIEDFFHLPPVSTTPVVHLELRISPRIFEKIRNGTNGILRALGETDSRKNRSQKSRDTVHFIFLQNEKFDPVDFLHKNSAPLPVYFVVDQGFYRLVEAGLRVDVNQLLGVPQHIWKKQKFCSRNKDKKDLLCLALLMTGICGSTSSFFVPNFSFVHFLRFWQQLRNPNNFFSF